MARRSSTTLSDDRPLEHEGIPTIVMPGKAAPHHAAGSDGTRPTLHHGWLYHRDGAAWLMTSDSFLAAAIEIRASGPLPDEGWVPYDALAHLARKRHAYGVRLGPFAVKVIDPGSGTTVTYDAAGDLGPSSNRATASWPVGSVAGYLFDTWGDKTEPLEDRVGFNAGYLTRLSKALGVDGREPFGMAFYGSPLKPIRVMPGNDETRRGVLMPIRLNV
jgi:hypothetical protein